MGLERERKEKDNEEKVDEGEGDLKGDKMIREGEEEEEKKM